LEEGIDIYDAWEYVYNKKSGKVRAFILDLGVTIETILRGKKIGVAKRNNMLKRNKKRMA
jgi:hypothetical protein